MKTSDIVSVKTRNGHHTGMVRHYTAKTFTVLFPDGTEQRFSRAIEAESIWLGTRDPAHEDNHNCPHGQRTDPTDLKKGGGLGRPCRQCGKRSKQCSCKRGPW